MYPLDKFQMDTFHDNGYIPRQVAALDGSYSVYTHNTDIA
jgi:hypothetical protein